VIAVGPRGKCAAAASLEARAKGYVADTAPVAQEWRRCNTVLSVCGGIKTRSGVARNEGVGRWPSMTPNPECCASSAKKERDPQFVAKTWRGLNAAGRDGLVLLSLLSLLSPPSASWLFLFCGCCRYCHFVSVKSRFGGHAEKQVT